jgi:hypothetical protein
MTNTAAPLPAPLADDAPLSEAPHHPTDTDPQPCEVAFTVINRKLELVPTARKFRTIKAANAYLDKLTEAGTLYEVRGWREAE